MEQWAGEVDVVWAETRKQSRGAGNTDRLGKRDCPNLYRAHSSGGGAMPNPNVITRIGCSDWPRPLMWPASLGRKLPHIISGKAIPSSGNIVLRPHEMT